MLWRLPTDPQASFRYVLVSGLLSPLVHSSHDRPKLTMHRGIALPLGGELPELRCKPILGTVHRKILKVRAKLEVRLTVEANACTKAMLTAPPCRAIAPKRNAVSAYLDRRLTKIKNALSWVHFKEELA